MLDVYRDYYALSGEPFRLGPDFRFSLHHNSYANAKAYLEFAIYQGEGFIAVTGGPGTGKTTLISEILSGLDREKFEVATLTSTQLESRDLLHMVASSFGLHPEKVEKADLLLEIESFLVSRIRAGHRAILIVDEAQGLPPGALEELRQLANLQYQYQLLLQIFLVGQESLLELIRAPGMEHLQQRLVAATSLEPLSLDETIDYIEHRLSRVGWKGDPAIDEAALRLLYRYSGGVPRRINLIANRLFLYGGMQHKHQFTGEDARAVIDGLIEEFLLSSEPPVDEPAADAQQTGKGRQAKPRSLPRTTTGTQEKSAGGKADDKSATPPAREKNAGRGVAPVSSDKPKPAGQGSFRLDRDSMPGSRPQSRTPRDDTQKPAASPAKPRGGPDSVARGATPRRRMTERPAPRPAPPAPEHKWATRGFYLLALVLLGAGGAYLLGGKSVDLNGLYSFTNSFTNGTATTGVQTDQAAVPAATDSVAVEVQPSPVEDHPRDAVSASPAETTGRVQPRALETGRINREGESGSADGAASSDGHDKDQALATQVNSGPPPPEATVDKKAPARLPVAAGETGQKGVGEDSSPQVVGKPRSTSEVARAPTPESANAARVASETDTVVKQTPDKTPASPARPVPTSVTPQSKLTAAAPGGTPVSDSPAPVKTAESANGPAPATESAPKPAPAVPASLKVAAAPAAAPASVSSPTKSEKPAPDALEAERARLKEAAEQRFRQQIASVQPGTGKPQTTAPAPVPVPKIAKAEPPATPSPAKNATGSADAVKKMLLEGRWSSNGKPASLLPSETTYCTSRVGEISCLSVPQTVKTQYGPALYKVETKLNGFSAGGLFEMSYRTLVRLVSSDGAANAQASGTDSEGWQISDYAMSCKLGDDREVSCVDDKGITRRYQRSATLR